MRTDAEQVLSVSLPWPTDRPRVALPTMTVAKIISGSQTGVDRGALDAALVANFPCGGWCPAGRQAEDGPIPSWYPVNELLGAIWGAYVRSLATMHNSLLKPLDKSLSVSANFRR